jgi:hypothetical protein
LETTRVTDKSGKQFGDAPGLLRRLAEAPGVLRRHLKGKQLISVDYRVSPRVRYGHGLPANPYLARLYAVRVPLDIRGTPGLISR